MEQDKKTYYKEHKEIMDARSKEWKIKNKERWNKYQAEYKRKKWSEQKQKNSQSN